jgi:hypothetical protein
MPSAEDGLISEEQQAELRRIFEAVGVDPDKGIQAFKETAAGRPIPSWEELAEIREQRAKRENREGYTVVDKRAVTAQDIRDAAIGCGAEVKTGVIDTAAIISGLENSEEPYAVPERDEEEPTCKHGIDFFHSCPFCNMSGEIGNESEE